MPTQEHLLQKAQDLVKYCDFSKSGRLKEGNWEDCWATTLREFIENDYDIRMLFPRFINSNEFIRYHGIYERFDERMLFENHRENILSYLPTEIDAILELGSGSGHNIAFFANKYPNTSIIGADWSKSAITILNILKRTFPNISGIQTDLFNEPNIRINNNTAIFTFHAFEQLGTSFNNALNWILKAKPRIVIQTEPIFEFYNAHDSFYRVAMDYHQKRNYLMGYWNALNELSTQGKIKIHQAQKSTFGNFFHDGYSLLVWEPL